MGLTLLYLGVHDLKECRHDSLLEDCYVRIGGEYPVDHRLYGLDQQYKLSVTQVSDSLSKEPLDDVVKTKLSSE